jgi:hypothetical protein
VITNLTVELVDIQAKILDVTSRQVSSLPVRDMVLWFFTREVSNHYVKKVKVLLSNWNNVTELLTGITSIPMSVRQLDRMPFASMMQQHQKLLLIMSNIKFNCTSEMIFQIMSSFYRLSQALKDVRVSHHTKLEHVSSCNLPLGLKNGIPSGTAHISVTEKHASKKQRSFRGYFKSG